MLVILLPKCRRLSSVLVLHRNELFVALPHLHREFLSALLERRGDPIYVLRHRIARRFRHRGGNRGNLWSKLSVHKTLKVSCNSDPNLCNRDARTQRGLELVNKLAQGSARGHACDCSGDTNSADCALESCSVQQWTNSVYCIHCTAVHILWCVLL